MVDYRLHEVLPRRGVATSKSCPDPRRFATRQECSTSVLRITHHFTRVGTSHGGVSQAIFDLLALQARQGHRVQLLTSSRSTLPRAWKEPCRTVPRVVELEPARGLFDRLSRRSLRRASETLAEADVLHLHGLWRPPNAQLARVARFLGTPYVITLHGMLDDWSMDQGSLRKRLYYRWFERANLAAAHSVHATAEAEAAQARRWLPHGRLDVIPCVMDLEPFRNLPAAETLLEGHPELESIHEPWILFLSRLHVKKRADILIEAVGRLQRAGKKCRLLIAGEGDALYVESLRRLAARESPGTILLGPVRDAPKLALFRHATVFALPTQQENFGLVLTEALACGTPVVTTRGADTWAELESSGGAVIVERTAGAFEQALEALLEDPARRIEMGRSGREWVFRWLDPERLAGQYEEMYRAAAR